MVIQNAQQYLVRTHDKGVVPVRTLEADLSHIDRARSVKGYVGAEQVADCFKGVDGVVILAGVPRKPGRTRGDLFNINAGIVHDLTSAIADKYPKALIVIITNAVNSCVPIAAEVLNSKGKCYPRILFGVSILDIVLARKFISDSCKFDVDAVDIPVIGGHSCVTVIPVISQCKPKVSFSQLNREKISMRTQEAGTEGVKTKAGARRGLNRF
ncbi:malate dehydrogenase, mitochondrial-like [Hermetia illucens]|uniref:malate dehydrogenase, mitochondrial-like n=1 Tax=Hermetia illucens TaxID=343691 RepID=UPI0018CC21CF|nr:malate dehydrogenase, mitochondrial-like [Hermetia illucens]